MPDQFKFFCKSEQGGGIVEYVFVIGLVAFAAVAVLQAMGVSINTKFASFNKL